MDKIAELLIRREYAKIGKNLPPKFWNLPEYKKKYSIQRMLAAKFLRSFDLDIILEVLEQEKWCYSLHAKCLTEKFQILKNKKELNQKLKEHHKQDEHVQMNHAQQFRMKSRKNFKNDE